MMSSRNIVEELDRGRLDRMQIEQVVIGSAMSFEECWQKANRILTGKVFSSRKNQFVWQLLADMKREGIEPDPVSMWVYARDKYPEMKNPCDLGVYIAELGMVVCYADYDKFVSALLKFYNMERLNGNGRK